MRLFGLAAIVAAFGLGFLLGQGTVATTRVAAEPDASAAAVRGSVRTLSHPTNTTVDRQARAPTSRRDAKPMPGARQLGAQRLGAPREQVPEQVREDLLDALRRAIESGQVAEYAALYPGWLERELFELYLGVGALTEASALIDRADFGPRALQQIAQKMLESGDRASAAELYRRLLEADPWDSSAQHGLRRSDPAALVSVLERELAARPNDPTLELKLGWALNAAGRSGDALELARQLLSADPESARGWQLFAQIAPDEAEAWTREMAASDRSWAPSLASLLEDRGATSEAIEVLSACLDAGFQEDAISQLTDLDPRAAASYLADWSRREPSDRDLMLLLAEAQESADLTTDSIETWSRVLSADSEAPDWKAARELLRLDPDRFFAEVRPGVEASEDPRRWSELAGWYESAGRVDAARAALDRAVQLEPWQRRWREQRAQLE